MISLKIASFLQLFRLNQPPDMPLHYETSPCMRWPRYASIFFHYTSNSKRLRCSIATACAPDWLDIRRHLDQIQGLIIGAAGLNVAKRQRRSTLASSLKALISRRFVEFLVASCPLASLIRRFIRLTQSNNDSPLMYRGCLMPCLRVFQSIFNKI